MPDQHSPQEREIELEKLEWTRHHFFQHERGDPMRALEWLIAKFLKFIGYGVDDGEH